MSPERIHVYEIVEPVPRSGPGRAYRARVASAGGPLAEGVLVQLRVVTETEAGGPAVLRDLEREHSAAQKIASPAVGAPVDFGLSDGLAGRRFWSVAPWVEGRTLTDVLAGAGSLPDPFVDAIAKQAADGLTAVHRAGLAAIGLSPDTLLVQDDTSIQILDPAFGAAHAAMRPAGGPAPAALACAAPEAIRDRAHCDERADLYSLGATLFRAMTGRWHRPDDSQALTCEPDSFPARRPSDVHPRLSVFLDELVFALVQPDRAKRFASFAELLKVLDERRDSAWWRSLNIAQESYDEARTERPRPASEPAPTPIPAPSPAPDAAWVAERRKRGFRLARHPARLVDREDELRGLVDAASRLRERGGQVRLIQGGPGSGKTRLVDALLDAIEEIPAAEAPIVLAGEHRRLGIGRPMRAFTEAIMRIVTTERDVTPAQISPLLGDAAAIAGAFAAFLSGSEPPEKSLPLTRDAIVGAFSRAFGSLCASTPVVLVIENLQWADPEALDLFEEIARLTSQMPLMVVGTFQPVGKTAPLSDVLASLRALDHVATIRIEPFSEPETQQIVLNLMAPDERAVALAKRLHKVCDGSGTRIVETIRLLEAEGSLVRDASRRLCATAATAGAELPVSEEAMWRRRIGRLGAAERAVLSMAAVQGYAFDADVVRLALGFSSLDMDRAFESLSAAAMV
jgi:hypothetical protein